MLTVCDKWYQYAILLYELVILSCLLLLKTMYFLTISEVHTCNISMQIRTESKLKIQSRNMIFKDQDVNKKDLHVPAQHLVKFALRRVSLKILKRPLTHHCILAETHMYVSIQWKVTHFFLYESNQFTGLL